MWLLRITNKSFRHRNLYGTRTVNNLQHADYAGTFMLSASFIHTWWELFWAAKWSWRQSHGMWGAWWCHHILTKINYFTTIYAVWGRHQSKMGFSARYYRRNSAFTLSLYGYKTLIRWNRCWCVCCGDWPCIIIHIKTGRIVAMLSPFGSSILIWFCYKEWWRCWRWRAMTLLAAVLAFAIPCMRTLGQMTVRPRRLNWNELHRSMRNQQSLQGNWVLTWMISRVWCQNLPTSFRSSSYVRDMNLAYADYADLQDVLAQLESFLADAGDLSTLGNHNHFHSLVLTLARYRMDRSQDDRDKGDSNRKRMRYTFCNS